MFLMCTGISCIFRDLFNWFQFFDFSSSWIFRFFLSNIFDEFLNFENNSKADAVQKFILTKPVAIEMHFLWEYFEQL